MRYRHRVRIFRWERARFVSLGYAVFRTGFLLFEAVKVEIV